MLRMSWGSIVWQTKIAKASILQEDVLWEDWLYTDLCCTLPGVSADKRSQRGTNAIRANTQKSENILSIVDTAFKRKSRLELWRKWKSPSLKLYQLRFITESCINIKLFTPITTDRTWLCWYTWFFTSYITQCRRRKIVSVWIISHFQAIMPTIVFNKHPAIVIYSNLGLKLMVTCQIVL